MRGFAWRPVLIVLAGKCALALPFAGRYGWQRDELYYDVAGRHLQAGYVDFPPLTGLLAACARLLFGDSLVGFRAFALAAGLVCTVLAALIARELGGGRRAQTVAAVVVGFAPIVISANGLFQPVSFDQALTLLVLWLALRVVLGRGGWLWLGAAVGVGLETKYTIAIPLLVLVAGTLVWRRDLLLSKGALGAAALALALVAPNLAWQAQHGWVSIHFFLHPPPSATAESRPQFVLNVLLLTGLVPLPLAVMSVRRLPRPLAWVAPGTALLFFALNGKSYYAAPALLFALAAGAVAVEHRRLLVPAVVYAGLLVATLPLGLPVLPQRTAIQHGLMKARSDYKDELGWPQLARTVEGASAGADVVIARNYGEAGALVVFGRGLPPVASGHVSFRYWRPHVSGRRAVLVGFGPVPWCAGYRVVARVAMPTENEERGQPVARCTLTAPLAAVWPRLVSD